MQLVAVGEPSTATYNIHGLIACITVRDGWITVITVHNHEVTCTITVSEAGKAVYSLSTGDPNTCLPADPHTHWNLCCAGALTESPVSGATPQKAAYEFAMKLYKKKLVPKSAANSSRNWAAGAFGLSKHCTAVHDWLRRADGWSPQQQKKDGILERQLKSQEKRTAELTEQLSHSHNAWYRTAANAAELKSEVTSMQKQCRTAEKDAQEKQVSSSYLSYGCLSNISCVAGHN